MTNLSGQIWPLKMLKTLTGVIVNAEVVLNVIAYKFYLVTDDMGVTS